jgi:hypothetical protein
MIAAIGFSDDEYHTPATQVFRCAGPVWPFRARSGSLRNLAARVVDEIKELEEALAAYCWNAARARSR